eukprot:2478888-Lingulodinium_polyedra.AAC.1
MAGTLAMPAVPRVQWVSPATKAVASPRLRSPDIARVASRALSATTEGPSGHPYICAMRSARRCPAWATRY